MTFPAVGFFEFLVRFVSVGSEKRTFLDSMFENLMLCTDGADSVLKANAFLQQ